MLNVYRYLTDQINTVKIIKANKGIRYLSMNNSYYYVYDYIDRKNVSRRNRQNVLSSARTLALFQNSNLNPPASKIQFQILSKNIKYVNKKIIDIYDDIEQSSIRLMLLSYYSYCKYQAKKALYLLPDLSKQVVKAEKAQQVCHGDCGLRNFISSKNSVYI